MKNLIIILILMLFITSCGDRNVDVASSTITAAEDYQEYLENDNTSEIEAFKQEVDFLREVVTEDSTRIVVMSQLAGKLDRLFDLTGEVDYLNESVSFRENVTQKTYIKPENAKRNLAQAYIKQHRFKKADSLMKSFTANYASKESQFVQFDIAMELGEYQTAQLLLDSLRNTGDYNYLIRAAKWNDHDGNLENTINLMEQAKQLADESGSQSRQLWSYSNIADYYGHNGQLEDSYEHYLKTLELDPGNTYALKGISWLVYSNDRDPDQALEILTTLKERHPLPDYNLEMAEVYEYKDASQTADSLRAVFLSQVSDPGYGDMYNAYKIEELIAAGESQQAVDLARLEITNRATPETYDLLGYALLSNDEAAAALENHKKYVIGKTYEPVAQLHTAQILKANNMNEMVEKLKKELLETEYELGPVTYKQIQAL
ncbi:tetratricopeptide repeat protein [Nonlabens ponticola]|uniref:Uncharacterized protein n=1 Tax=Nonlabens ponticola TaxID=2496866 RepID=A0A3S9MYF2_9FLAO|nr:hypothetical protein [Nonlabens ponticola]AZQ44144.1 hypothetical protein EJ995_07835 [Nonlabens ponticola]